MGTLDSRKVIVVAILVFILATFCLECFEEFKIYFESLEKK